MRIATELKAAGCADSPEKFRDRLLEEFIDRFPNTTIDDLLCDPERSVQFCRGIRTGVGTENLIDVVILKSLTNIRKRRDCPTNLKKRKRRNLQKELEAVGCRLEVDEFKTVVCDCMADMYKSRTIDELLCHPNEARELCEYARRKACCGALGDLLILSTLMNARKSP